MIRDIQKVLIDRQCIAQRVREIAAQITLDLCGSDDPDALDRQEITLIPILTGSLIFLSDLIRHLPLRMRLRLISVSSYPGTATSSQGVTIHRALDTIPARLDGAHVLLIDDILDSGNTLRSVSQLLRERNPASVRTCVLLRKQRPEAMSFPVDYVGFDIPDLFVVGYGLDFDGYYRNLPEIVTLQPRVIEALMQAQLQAKGTA